MVNHGMILVMAADTSPGVTLTDVLERYGQHWHIEAAEFCYVAVRRPTPTRQEKDDLKHTVWVVYASAAHPKATE